jgi:hypothetical protein
VTPADAISALDSAIGVAEIWQQQKPAGHPIFAAVATARTALSRIQSAAVSSGSYLTQGTQLWADADGALESLYAIMGEAEGGDPAKTIYQTAQALPWTWIGAGLGLLAVGFYLFKGKR